MKPLAELVPALRSVRGLLADIDDTISTDGRITAAAYGAMERMQSAGLLVIPITGRPAGWCDHIARMWPVDAIVGENGAFYMRYDRRQRKLVTRMIASDADGSDADGSDADRGDADRGDADRGDADRGDVDRGDTNASRAAERQRLRRIGELVLREVPGSAWASDQPYRAADIAIDFCEDVPRLPPAAIAKIVTLMHEQGLTAKVSSIHVNGWFGNYDKLGMTRTLLREEFDIDLDARRRDFVFIGDSPNDAPMFGFFPISVGVANVSDFIGAIPHLPAYVTPSRSGAGFVELADLLVSSRS